MAKIDILTEFMLIEDYIVKQNPQLNMKQTRIDEMRVMDVKYIVL